MSNFRIAKAATAVGVATVLAAAAGAAQALTFSLVNSSPPTATQPASGLQYNKIGDPVKLLLDLESLDGLQVEILKSDGVGGFVSVTTGQEVVDADALRVFGTVAGYFSDVNGNFANATGALCQSPGEEGCFDASNSGAFALDFLYTGGLVFDPKSEVGQSPLQFDFGAVGDILGQSLGENTGHPLFTVNQPEPLLGPGDNPGVGSGSLLYLGKLIESEGLSFALPDAGEDLENFNIGANPFATSSCFDSSVNPCFLDMAISPIEGDQFSIGEGFAPVSFALYPNVTQELRDEFLALGFSGAFDPDPDPQTSGVFCASPFLNAQGGSLPTDPNALSTFCNTPIADSNGVRSLPNAGLGPVTLSRAVPEPGSLALLGLALAGLLGRGRERRL